MGAQLSSKAALPFATIPATVSDHCSIYRAQCLLFQQPCHPLMYICNLSLQCLTQPLSTHNHQACLLNHLHDDVSKWKHLSTLLALSAGNSPVYGEFPAQRPVTWSFDDFFYLHLIKRQSKHSWGWWFEMLSRPLWHHCNKFTQLVI